MIDACAPLRRFAMEPPEQYNMTPLLRWVETWRQANGQGVTLGLLDTGCDMQVPDLLAADVSERSFTGSSEVSDELRSHGTHAAAMLVGQGHYQIRGIAPHARLLLAKVVGQHGVAAPQAIADAIDWLAASGAQIVALPLGESAERAEVARQIEHGASCGIAFFAAAGN